MRSQKKSAAIAYEAFDAQRHLSGDVEIYRPPRWDDFRHGPDPTRRSPTTPGSTAPVAGAVANRLARRAFETTGAGRTDLIASDRSPDLHGALKHIGQVGFRIYPDHDIG